MAQGLITREIQQSQMRNWHGCHTNTKRTASYTEIGKPAGTHVTLVTLPALQPTARASRYATWKRKASQRFNPQNLLADS